MCSKDRKKYLQFCDAWRYRGVPPRYHGTILLLLCGINNPITIEALINDCPFHHSYKIDVSCIRFEQIFMDSRVFWLYINTYNAKYKIVIFIVDHSEIYIQ